MHKINRRLSCCHRIKSVSVPVVGLWTTEKGTAEQCHQKMHPKSCPPKCSPYASASLYSYLPRSLQPHFARHLRGGAAHNGALRWKPGVYQSGKDALIAADSAVFWQYRHTHTLIYYTAGDLFFIHKQCLDMEHTDVVLLWHQCGCF